MIDTSALGVECQGTKEGWRTGIHTRNGDIVQALDGRRCGSTIGRSPALPKRFRRITKQSSNWTNLATTPRGCRFGHGHIFVNNRAFSRNQRGEGSS